MGREGGDIGLLITFSNSLAWKLWVGILVLTLTTRVQAFQSIIFNHWRVGRFFLNRYIVHTFIYRPLSYTMRSLELGKYWPLFLAKLLNDTLISCQTVDILLICNFMCLCRLYGFSKKRSKMTYFRHAIFKIIFCKYLIRLNYFYSVRVRKV